MSLDQLTALLEPMGCPREKSTEVASPLDKRARPRAKHKGRYHEEAMAHLISLMQQGWAAKQGDASLAICDG